MVGGSLAGVVRVPIDLNPEDGFRETFTCWRVATSDSADDRTTRQDILWQSSCVVRKLDALAAAHSAIPVQFHVPFDAAPTSLPDDSTVIIWRLDIEAAAPGVDLHASFDVPVFRTVDSSPDFELDHEIMAGYVRDESLWDLYRRCGLRRTETIHGLRVEFPLFRNLGTSLGLTAFLAGWLTVIGLMFQLGMPGWLTIIFAAFACLIACFVVELWMWSSVVEVESHTLHCTMGLVGCARSRKYSRDQVQEIRVLPGMRSGQTLHYDLELVVTDGSRFRIGRRLPSQAAAMAVADDIRQTLMTGKPAGRKENRSVPHSTQEASSGAGT